MSCLFGYCALDWYIVHFLLFFCSKNSKNSKKRTMHTDTLRPHALLNTPTATDPTASLSPMARSVYLDFKGVGRSVIQSGVRPSVCLSVPSLGRRTPPRRVCCCCCGPGGCAILIDCYMAGPTAANASNAVVFSVLTLSFLVISAENTCVCVFVRMLEGSANLLQY